MNLPNNFTILLVALSFPFTYTNAEFRVKVDSSSSCVDTDEQLYVVAIYHAKEYVCVGSLITMEWVVTAAECIEDQQNLKVKAGPKKRRQVRKNFPEVFTAGMDLSIIKVNPAFNPDSVGTIELCKTVLQERMPIQVSGWLSFRTDICANVETIYTKFTCRQIVNGQRQETPRISTSGPEIKTGAPGVVNGALCAVAGSGDRSSYGIYTDLSADSAPLLFIKERTGCP